MGLARYFLLQRGGSWLVTLEGQVMAQCASRTQAFEAAVTMADLMGAMHHDADVMVETESGSGLEVVWSYGRDPVRKASAARRDLVRPPQHRVRLVQKGEARRA